MFKLERNYIQEIIAHARAEAPIECCGVLAGMGSNVTKLYRTINCEKSSSRYSVEPGELLRIYRELDEKDWRLLAVYHSHPYSDAYPSPIDIKLAQFLDIIHVIVSLNGPEPVVRAFRLADGSVKEVSVVQV